MALFLNLGSNIDNLRQVYMLKTQHLIILFLFFPLLSMSQKISPRVFDFGKVKNWNNPDAEFVITNTGNQAFVFLPGGYHPQYFISTPQGQVQPGGSAVIKVKYYTRTGGKFEQSIPLFISSRQEPVMLEIKGVILSFAEDAMMMCPQITGSGNASEKELLEVFPEIEVVDAISGVGLTNVDILVRGALKSYAFEDTRKSVVKLRGVQVGLYYVDCSREGYEPYFSERYIDKGTFRIRVEMKPVNEPMQADTEEKQPSSEDEVIVVTNNPYEEKEAIERIRKMMDKKFKGREIIERDVVVINPVEQDSLSALQDSTPLKSIPDLAADGSLDRRKYADNNIVFLIDVSGSMLREDKLPFLKTAMKQLVKVLRHNDRVTIIVYSTKPEVILQSVRGSEKEKINAVIDGLEAKGQSYGAEGLDAAYYEARMQYISGGNNQVILASDGIFNSRDFSEKKIYKKVKEESDQGIILSTIAFGKTTAAINFMKEMANQGNGSFLQILSESDAQSSLVEEIKRQSARNR